MEKNKKLDARIRRNLRKKARQEQAGEAPEANKQQQDAYLGAGLRLNWRKISGKVFDKKVAPHLAKVGDTSKQIWFLQSLFAEFNFHTQEIGREMASRDYGLSLYAREIAIAEYKSDCQEFAAKLQSKVDYLKEVARIEYAAKRRDAALQKEEKATGAELEGGPAGQQWNNDALAVAIYALLRAADLPDDAEKTAIARFAQCLTGRSEQNLRSRLYEALGGRFSKKTAANVARQFDQMGLPKVAADVRKYFAKL